MVVQPVKNLIKAPLQLLGATFGRHRWQVPEGGRLLVLTYHRVLPLDHPDRKSEQPGMIVSPETLAMHCQQLARHFEFIHLDKWLQRQSEGTLERKRYCALTFDDDWKDNYDYAFPILRSAGVPATFFLVVGQVGSSYQFWPNRLARLLANASSVEKLQVIDKLRKNGIKICELPAEPSPGDIDTVIETCKALPDATINRLLGDDKVSDGSRDLMNWDELREMAQSGLARFGSHTLNHTRLIDGVEPTDLQIEIADSKKLLEDKLGEECALFCFPNGDCNADGMALVREHYKGAASTGSGWNGPNADPFVLRRIGLHEDIANSPTRFLSRIGGLI
jgi:peptidoglycan/xylan/chitin deacetylase (PgdA/CDA1 family)